MNVLTPPQTSRPAAGLFTPDRVYFEPEALDYPLGRALYTHFADAGLTPRQTSSHHRVTGIPGATPQQAYGAAKRTLVVGVKRDLDFETCRPSADYSLVLATGCPGMCEYCYLQSTLGRKPYVRVYVNVDEILAAAAKTIKARAPELTVFEGASTADPLSVEHLTGSLQRAIEFFGQQEFGRFRFVTKYAAVGPLLEVAHRGHTRIRFTLNAEPVRRLFERRTAPLAARLEAALSLRAEGYPIGFVLAPLMLFDGWRAEYAKLLDQVAEALAHAEQGEAEVDPDTSGTGAASAEPALTFELIQYRFTAASKRIILERFPQTRLDLEEEGRRYKRGKYGLGKWVYAPAQAEELKDFLTAGIAARFPRARIDYFT